jgi:hypothetical protein
MEPRLNPGIKARLSHLSAYLAQPPSGVALGVVESAAKVNRAARAVVSASRFRSASRRRLKVRRTLCCCRRRAF